jgi:5'-nucleotidase
MRLLITNDDGINSIGLQTLVKEMEKDNEVWVVAPDRQRSACGHSITINKPLFVKEVKIEGIKSRCFNVDGTPADCVKVAMERIIKGKIDMVLSGINKGPNLGTDVIYSGTVSAAIEAAIYKIPSAAISLDVKEDEGNYSTAAKYAAKIVSTARENYISNDIVLNINVPHIDEKYIKGIKVCQLGNRIYANYYIESLREDKTVGLLLQGDPKDSDEENTDVYYLKKGYVTLTPLHYDLTNFKILNDVNKWFEKH